LKPDADKKVYICPESYLCNLKYFILHSAHIHGMLK